MSFCIGCGSAHVELDKTWSEKGSLVRTRWLPYPAYRNFTQGPHTRENYCGMCGSSNNSRGIHSWTKRGNLQPHDTQGGDDGDYLLITKAWAQQRPYAS